jgi:hypothetical protein
MATLLQVAQKLGDLTVAKAPKKTGNLKRQLKTANTGRNILGGRNSAQAEKQIIEDLKTGTFTFEFDIDVAPAGAEYGQWWNSPTIAKNVSKGKTRNIPDGINFGEKAYNDPQFQRMLDDYIEVLTDKVAASIAKAVDRELQ